MTEKCFMCGVGEAKVIREEYRFEVAIGDDKFVWLPVRHDVFSCSSCDFEYCGEDSERAQDISVECFKIGMEFK